jgi:hypothetical protein
MAEPACFSGVAAALPERKQLKPAANFPRINLARPSRNHVPTTGMAKTSEAKKMGRELLM